ncbi:hypothetical protein, partial [Thiolapillus sp.]
MQSIKSLLPRYYSATVAHYNPVFENSAISVVCVAQKYAVTADLSNIVVYTFRGVMNAVRRAGWAKLANRQADHLSSLYLIRTGVLNGHPALRGRPAAAGLR